MLKVSASYLEKQKSFIPKKIFLGRCQYQNKKLCLLTQILVKVLRGTTKPKITLVSSGKPHKNIVKMSVFGQEDVFANVLMWS